MLRHAALTGLVALLMLTACADKTAPVADEAPAKKETAAGAKSPGLPISKAPEDARLYFIAPADGATVTSPVLIQFGLRGMGVAPAGVDVPNTGHHHLLIDVDELPDLSKPLPATEHIRHFGGGQTEALIELAPGTHTLQLLLGNYLHIPHSPPVLSEPITITVVPPAP